MNDDDAAKLNELLSDPDAEISAGWIEELQRKYPFFSLPQGVALRGGKALAEAERNEIISRIAMSLPDGDAARRIVEGGDDRFDGFYPEKPSAGKSPSTDQAIDKFLATYGSGDEAETEVLEKLIFNPVADYSQQLERQEADSLPDVPPDGDSQDARIERFILSVKGKEVSGTGETPGQTLVAPGSDDGGMAARPVPARNEVQPPRPAADNTLLSESLAKIYIKTHRYERAYEILSRLSLSFPEKNAYFADQLRFLRKLMLVEELRRKRNDKENAE